MLIKVGALEVGQFVIEDGDFPWFYGRLIPGQDFAAFQPYLRPVTGHPSDFWLDLDKLAQTGILPADMCVIHPDHETTYLLALRLSPNQRAALLDNIVPYDQEP